MPSGESGIHPISSSPQEWAPADMDHNSLKYRATGHRWNPKFS
jgi:hypothetical protein